MNEADVGDAVLEQIADAAGVLGDQIHRVGLVAKLGEHQDADLGVLAADLDRGAQAVVGVVGRHLHVDHRDIRTVRGDLALEVDRIPRLRDDVEAVVGQQAAEPLAQQQLVLGDHDPQRRHSPNAIRALDG